MPFMFSPCRPCCISCDGYTGIKIGCEPSPPTISGFPSYLNVGTGDVSIIVYDSGGNIVGTCYPLTSSGICEFKLNTTGQDTDTLFFASSLNTPSMTGFFNCYPEGTGIFNINALNNLSAAFPCWIPNSGVTLTFYWNYENNVYTQEAGIYPFPTGLPFSVLCDCLGPPSSFGTNTYIQTHIFASNPLTVFVPFGTQNCFSTGILLATIESTLIASSGHSVCNIAGVSCGASVGPTTTINSGIYCTYYSATDYYAYFTLSASCAQTYISYYIHSVDHGQPKPYPTCPNPLPNTDFIETYYFPASGVTSCSPLLMTSYGALRTTNICQTNGPNIAISGVNQATITK